MAGCSCVVAVEALECDGDWFVVPSDLVDEFNKFTQPIDRYAVEFEEKFGHMRTGGDLNLTQLYIKT
jgi:hypothetical protein